MLVPLPTASVSHGPRPAPRARSTTTKRTATPRAAFHGTLMRLTSIGARSAVTASSTRAAAMAGQAGVMPATKAGARAAATTADTTMRVRSCGSALGGFSKRPRRSRWWSSHSTTTVSTIAVRAGGQRRATYSLTDSPSAVK